MFSDKLKKFFEKNGEEDLDGKMNIDKNNKKGNDKKKVENLIFFVIVLIITIVVINLILTKDNSSSIKEENDTTSKQLASTKSLTTNQSDSSSNDNTKTELENILKKIQGVGDVKVFVNYSESSETVAMFNEDNKVSQTEETDTSGGVRTIQETNSKKEIIYKEDNGEKIPVTQKTVSPKVEGAIITAKGASNANVKANIIQAVEAVTGLPTHKIQVFEMN